MKTRWILVIGTVVAGVFLTGLLAGALDSAAWAQVEAPKALESSEVGYDKIALSKAAAEGGGILGH